MRKNRGWICLVIFSVGGCVRQSPSAYVDLQTILNEETPSHAPKAVTAQQPPPFSIPASSLPPLPEEIIARPADGAPSAEQLLRQNRLRAYRDLEARLRDVYLSEVHRAEQAQIDLLTPSRTQAEQDARQKLRDLFDRYASQRGPLVTQIALIAGFPDPDPKSRMQPVLDNPLTRFRMGTAKRLRSQIDDLDKQYDVEARRILLGLDQQADAELTRIKAEMEVARGNAEVQARKEAAKQVRVIERNIGASLASEGNTVLPAISGKTAPGSAVPIPLAQPRTEAPKAMDDSAARQKLLSDELAIWLAVNGYRQEVSRDKAPDRTAEFIEWRKTHRLGP